MAQRPLGATINTASRSRRQCSSSYLRPPPLDDQFPSQSTVQRNSQRVASIPSGRHWYGAHYTASKCAVSQHDWTAGGHYNVRLVNRWLTQAVSGDRRGASRGQMEGCRRSSKRREIAANLQYPYALSESLIRGTGECMPASSDGGLRKSCHDQRATCNPGQRQRNRATNSCSERESLEQRWQLDRDAPAKCPRP